MTIYLECIQPRSTPVPVKLGLVRHGRNTFFRIVSDNGQFDLLLKATANDFIDLLEPKIETLKAAVGLAPPGILRGPTQAEQYHHEPADEITITDIKEDMPVAEKLAIIIRRFENSPANLTGPYTIGFVDDLKAIYKKHAGHSYDKRDEGVAGDGGLDQLEADLALVRPHVDKLKFKSTGEFVKDRVAKRMGLSQAGGAFGLRVDAVIEALEREAA
jgi:hypothetical protein